MRERLAEALCRWWDDVDQGCDPGHGDEFPCRHCLIEADALLPAVEHEITAAEQRGAERALREAADEWTHGAWADAPRRFDRIAERIANGQHVGDWLRDRAALTADPTMGGWLDTADPDRAPLDDRLADGKAGR